MFCFGKKIDRQGACNSLGAAPLCPEEDIPSELSDAGITIVIDGVEFPSVRPESDDEKLPSGLNNETFEPEPEPYSECETIENGGSECNSPDEIASSPVLKKSTQLLNNKSECVGLYTTSEGSLNDAPLARRWRRRLSAARKQLRLMKTSGESCSEESGPRIIDNLGCEPPRPPPSSADLADRLRSLAAADGISASACELSLPISPLSLGLDSPTISSDPDRVGWKFDEEYSSTTEAVSAQSPPPPPPPSPPPGPRYKLAKDACLQVCSLNHTRTVINKILTSKFLRRWEAHHLILEETFLTSRTPTGCFEAPLSYSSIEEVYAIARWDAVRKFCLRIVIPTGSLIVQANNAYTRDQWYHSIVWRKNMLRYRQLLTNNKRQEIILKELKNMTDYVTSVPLQDESVTSVPLDIVSQLLVQEQDRVCANAAWCSALVGAAGAALRGAGGAERAPAAPLARALTAAARATPRAARLPAALAAPAAAALRRNVDFARAPHLRDLVHAYIRSLSSHNNGEDLIQSFVRSLHGAVGILTCPHPRVLPNLAAACVAALARSNPLTEDDEVVCFADVLVHISSYTDWLPELGAILQPIPFPTTTLMCPEIATRLAVVLERLAVSGRMSDLGCRSHTTLLPSRPPRPGWLQYCCPTNPMIALSPEVLINLWGIMLTSLIGCCCRRKNFIRDLMLQLPALLILALREHKAALDAICLMLEWDLLKDNTEYTIKATNENALQDSSTDSNNDVSIEADYIDSSEGEGGSACEQAKVEAVAVLRSTLLGRKYYDDLCARQQNLKELRAVGGPRRLALAARATDSQVAEALSARALGSLTALSLAFTAVTSACAAHLIKLPGLKYLNLWATQFGDSGVELIAEHLEKLQVLNLCETPVSDKGIRALSVLSNLRKLNLNSTKLSAATFADLKQKLPNLQEFDVRYTEAW